MKTYFKLMAVMLPVLLFPFMSADAKDKVRIGGDVVVVCTHRKPYYAFGLS